MNKKSMSAEKVSLLVNCILLGLGIVLIAVPNLAMSTITMVLGIVLASYGAITLITAIVKKDGESVTMPVMFTVFGTVLLVFNNFFSNMALPLIVGIWMLVMGIMGAISSVTFRAYKPWKISLLLNLVAAAAGLVILSGLAMKTNMAAVFLGAVFVVYGIMTIVNTKVVSRMAKGKAAPAQPKQTPDFSSSANNDRTVKPA